jgi:hypothetical protein
VINKSVNIHTALNLGGIESACVSPWGAACCGRCMRLITHTVANSECSHGKEAVLTGASNPPPPTPARTRLLTLPRGPITNAWPPTPTSSLQK